MAPRPAYLFSKWSDVEERLRGKFVYLFLDYDGTLTPIVDVPKKAVLSKEAKALLRRLATIRSCKVAIISGRALSDVRARVGIKEFVYVGNHGFEVKGPRIVFKSPVPPKYRWVLERVKDKLKKELGGIKGVLVEDKGFSLCVHYRMADRKSIPLIKAAFYGALLLHEVRGHVKVRTGKMVLEVRLPVNWDKGKVVMWLLARTRFAEREKQRKVLPVYIGDDATDEDAFRVLRQRGITVFVGKPKKTAAQYYLKGPQGVITFLGGIERAITRKD